MRFRYLYFVRGTVAAYSQKKLAEKVIGVNNGTCDVDSNTPLHRVAGKAPKELSSRRSEQGCGQPVTL